MKVTQKQSQVFKRDGLNGWNYKLPTIENGVSVVFNKLTGTHEQRTTDDRARIYFIISGEGIYKINDMEEQAKQNDVVVIPPHSTFNFWAINKTTLKCVLFTKLLDIPK